MDEYCSFCVKKTEKVFVCMICRFKNPKSKVFLCENCEELHRDFHSADGDGINSGKDLVKGDINTFKCLAKLADDERQNNTGIF